MTKRGALQSIRHVSDRRTACVSRHAEDITSMMTRLQSLCPATRHSLPQGCLQPTDRQTDAVATIAMPCHTDISPHRK